MVSPWCHRVSQRLQHPVSTLPSNERRRHGYPRRAGYTRCPCHLLTTLLDCNGTTTRRTITHAVRCYSDTRARVLFHCTHPRVTRYCMTRSMNEQYKMPLPLTMTMDCVEVSSGRPSGGRNRVGKHCYIQLYPILDYNDEPYYHSSRSSSREDDGYCPRSSSPRTHPQDRLVHPHTHMTLWYSTTHRLLKK